MGARAHAQWRGSLVTGLVLLGALAAGAPAYSAPADCEPARTCQPEPKEPKKPPKPPPDTEAPSAPFLGEVTVEPAGRVELSVAAEADAKLVVEEDGTRVVARATATGASQQLSWTTTDGSHTYAVTATDKAGNESEPASVRADVDAKPPPVRRFVTRSGDGKDSKSIVGIRTAPNTAFRLLVDERLVQRGTAADGRIEQRLDLADGRHRVRVELKDDVGNLATATRPLVVRIPKLDIKAELTSKVTDAVQVIEVRAPAADVGVVKVPGELSQRFRLANGVAEVEIALPDGTYEDATVTVADRKDRAGSAPLPGITVDTTAPALAVEPDQVAAGEGKFSAKVSTEVNTVISWRLLDGEEVVADGEYVAVQADQTIGRDVEEGGYELVVEATDTYGRTTVERLSSRIATDPLSMAVLALAVAGLLLLLGALLVGAVLLRRRRRQGAATQSVDPPEPAVSSTEQAADYEEAEERWRRRHASITRVLDVAQGGVPVAVPPPAEVTLLPEEKVLHTTGARLTDEVDGDGTAVVVEVDGGELVVTTQRLAFVGEQHRRDWWFPLVERITHVDHQHTTIELRESDTRSGLAYDDAEETRLYIDLARSDQNGTRKAYLAGLTQGLRAHELRRPAPPRA